MSKLKYLFLMISALFAVSCGKFASPAAPTVEYARACEPANQGKIIAVQGFLNVVNQTPCLKMMRVGKNGAFVRDCVFKLLDKVNVVGNEIIVYLPEGKELNQVETPDAGKPGAEVTSMFPRENIKLRLDDGTEIVPQESIATPVTVTGEIRLTDKGDGTGKVICSLTAAKVEKR